MKKIARGYRCCHHAAHAAAKVYMAKLLGKNAVLETNIPAEKI